MDVSVSYSVTPLPLTCRPRPSAPQVSTREVMNGAGFMNELRDEHIGRYIPTILLLLFVGYSHTRATLANVFSLFYYYL